MSNCRSKRQVVILDCCFSGAFAEGLLAKDDAGVDVKNQLGGEGRAVLTSSTSTQYSFEQQGSDLSIYTHYLVEGISTGVADQDQDGMVSVDELHEYAKGKVQEAAPAMKPEIYAVKEGYKILLTKAPIGDPKLRYRQEVERFASRGDISLIGRIVLDEQRKQLEIPPEEANVIEEKVLKPYREYQRKLQLYEQAFVKAIGRESPLGDVTRNELKQLQQVFGLRNEDVAPIEKKSLVTSLQTSPTPQTEAETSQQSTDDQEKVVSKPADLGVVVPQLQPEAETPAAFNPEFTERCRRELARCIGPVASFILQDTLNQHPQIAPQQLIESLTAEITNPQKAQEFRQRLL
jgi:Ca2+-binding EF-hand superfamily protein